MFGLNAQAKVRDTNINFINGLALQPSIYSNNNPAFSPRSGLGGNFSYNQNSNYAGQKGSLKNVNNVNLMNEANKAVFLNY